jgi:hypothetical protein
LTHFFVFSLEANYCFTFVAIPSVPVTNVQGMVARLRIVTGIDPSGRGGVRQVRVSPVIVKVLMRVVSSQFGKDARSTLKLMVLLSASTT